MRTVIRLFLLLLLGAIPAKATCDAGQSSTTPSSVGGTYTVVQFCAYSAIASADTNRAQFLQALAAGNLAVFVGKQCQSISCNTSFPAGLTASDNVNGAYSCPAGAVFQSTDADNSQSVCWFCNTAASAVTVSYGNLADWVGTALFEVHSSSGACNGLGLDTHRTLTGVFPASSTTNSVPATSATTAANELAISQIFGCPNTLTFGAAGIFTKVTQYGNGTFGCGLAVEMGNVTTLGTTAASNWTISPSSSVQSTLVTLTPFTSGSKSRSHSTIINYQPTHRAPWDNRRRKLEIVRI